MVLYFSIANQTISSLQKKLVILNHNITEVYD